MIFPRVMFGNPDSRAVLASAKINLFLEILGERDDGYHDLRSIMVPVSLHDELTLENTDGVIESCLLEGSSVCCAALVQQDPRQNLATRAALGLKAATGHAGGARIAIRKHIPVGGGLGGGSADAAAVLLGLNDLWGTDLDCAALSALGAQIGCDVPALVHGGLVLVQGLGERVSPLVDTGRAENEGIWLVLVNPGFSVSTQDVYRRCRVPLTSVNGFYTSMVCSLRDGDVEGVARSLFNGLEATVFGKYPEIELIAGALRSAGSPGALLSGSGASVFGLARSEAHADSIRDAVQADLGPSLWSKVVRLLPDGVMVAHGPLEA